MRAAPLDISQTRRRCCGRVHQHQRAFQRIVGKELHTGVILSKYLDASETLSSHDAMRQTGKRLQARKHDIARAL